MTRNSDDKWIYKECHCHGILAEDIPWLQNKAFWEKKVKWSLQSKIGNKHKCKGKLLMQNLSRSLHAVPLIFGTVINNNFDDISHLSINHLATNRNNCINVSKPWLVSVPFFAITKCWCLFGLWQPAVTAKCTRVNMSVCVSNKSVPVLEDHKPKKMFLLLHSKH